MPDGQALHTRAAVRLSGLINCPGPHVGWLVQRSDWCCRDDWYWFAEQPTQLQPVRSQNWIPLADVRCRPAYSPQNPKQLPQSLQSVQSLQNLPWSHSLSLAYRQLFLPPPDNVWPQVPQSVQSSPKLQYGVLSSHSPSGAQ